MVQGHCTDKLYWISPSCDHWINLFLNHQYFPTKGKWQNGELLNGTAWSLDTCELVCHENLHVFVASLYCAELGKKSGTLCLFCA